MTELATDDRPIAAESPLYTSTLVRREDLTDSLAFFWVRSDGDFVDFEAGQYLTIGVESSAKLVQRPYSVASSPRDRVLRTNRTNRPSSPERPSRSVRLPR